MTKQQRGPTDYLSDDWGIKKGGDPDSDASIPNTQDMPPNPEWGLDGPEGSDGGYGHSSDVKNDPTAARWNMSKEDLAKGFERPGSGDAGKPGTASFEQSIPDTNVHDRGAGSESFAREGEWAGGEGFDGRGNDKPSPGRQALGTRPVNT
jgi:hypothetical protein